MVAFFLHGSAPNVFVSDTRPAPATNFRPLCEHCDQRVGRTRDDCASLRAHGAVVGLSIDVFRGLRRSPHLINAWLSFSQAGLWRNICPGIISFGLILRVWDLIKKKRRARSEGYRNGMAGINEIQTYSTNIELPLY